MLFDTPQQQDVSMGSRDEYNFKKTANGFSFHGSKQIDGSPRTDRGCTPSPAFWPTIFMKRTKV
jgi:hypothetical protein